MLAYHYATLVIVIDTIVTKCKLSPCLDVINSRHEIRDHQGF